MQREVESMVDLEKLVLVLDDELRTIEKDQMQWDCNRAGLGLEAIDDEADISLWIAC